MIVRLAALVVTLLFAGAVATGCTGEPDPAPSTPTFTSDEEAFAAAEATYRAYVDALNANRLDEASEPSPQDFLIGEALESDIQTQRQLDAEGLTIAGDSVITSIQLDHVSESRSTVELVVCLDASRTFVLNRAGVDVTPPSRTTLLALDVAVVGTGDDQAISRSSSSEDQTC